MALDLKVIISALNQSGTGIKQATVDLERLGTVGRQMQTVGLGMMGAGAAIGGGLMLAAKSAADLGETLLIASAKTGATVESLGALRYAAEKSDVSFGSLTGAMTKMTRAAAEGKLDEFGISVKDAEGKMKSADAILMEFTGYLEKLPDQGSRNAAAFKVFGRSAADLMPLLNEGKTGIMALTKEAQGMGVVMSKEAAEAADSMGDELEALKMTTKGLMVAVGADLAPVLKDMIVDARGVAAGVHKWMTEHPELTKQLTRAAAAGTSLLLAAGGMTFIGGKVIATYAKLAQAALYLKTANLSLAASWGKALFIGLALLELGGRLAHRQKLMADLKEATAAGDQARIKAIKEEMRAADSLKWKDIVKSSGLKFLLAEVDKAFGVTETVGVGSFDKLRAEADDLKAGLGGVREEVQGLGADLEGLAPTAAVEGGTAAAGGGITLPEIMGVAGAVAAARATTGWNPRAKGVEAFGAGGAYRRSSTRGGMPSYYGSWPEAQAAGMSRSEWDQWQGRRTIPYGMTPTTRIAPTAGSMFLPGTQAAVTTGIARSQAYGGTPQVHLRVTVDGSPEMLREILASPGGRRTFEQGIADAVQGAAYAY